MVIVALADFVVSVSEVAVIVTMPLFGTDAGAVYVVPAGDPVELVGLNEPHTPEPQAAVQITPFPIGSFVTLAVSNCVLLTCNELGVVPVNAIAIVTGVARIVMFAVLACAGLLVTAARMVTAVPIGGVDGAV